MAKQSEETWSRRIGNKSEEELWKYLAQPRIWLDITNPQGSDPNINNSDSQVINNDNVNTFTKLSPGKKWNLISKIVKPHSATYNKDKTMSVQVLKEDGEKLLGLSNIGSVPVNISKHKFKNTIRGTIKSRTLCEMPTEEIRDWLKAFNCVEARHLHSPPKRFRRKHGQIRGR